MDTDKKTEDSTDKKEEPSAGAGEKTPDAESLTKPADDGSEKKDDSVDASSDKNKSDDKDSKPAEKPNSFKQTIKRVRLYLLIIALVALVGGIYVMVTGLNKKKTPPPPSVQSQSVTQDQLKQLKKSAGISTNGQTLTIQGDGILDGQELVKGNLYVAGYIQSGGTLSIPALTISNNGILGSAQSSKLQVAKTSAFTGTVTLQSGLDLNGPTAISNATVGTLTATKLIVGSDGTLTVPNHLAFTGAFPHRSISFGVLGNGGSASVNGSDTSGTVTINTGNNPQPGCFITIIFLIPFTGTPNIILGPIGLGAGATQHSAQPIVSPDTGDTTAFKICTANKPLPNQAFAFSYLVNGSPH